MAADRRVTQLARATSQQSPRQSNSTDTVHSGTQKPSYRKSLPSSAAAVVSSAVTSAAVAAAARRRLTQPPGVELTGTRATSPPTAAHRPAAARSNRSSDLRLARRDIVTPSRPAAGQSSLELCQCHCQSRIL